MRRTGFAGLDLVMKIPKDEIPSVDEIRQLALVNLPPHYKLLGVRCSCGPAWPDFLPEDFEIVIEYESAFDSALEGSLEGIEAYRSWAHALTQDISGDWPPESLRVRFQGRCAADKDKF